MNSRRHSHSMRLSRSAGFTLVELMITVVIVAILMAVALPSYRQHTVKSNRAAAQGFMLEVANKQEQFLLGNRRYASGLSQLQISSPGEVADHYAVSVTSGTGLSYTVTATPKGAQGSSDTECGVLTLDHTGAKGAAGGGQRCWR